MTPATGSDRPAVAARYAADLRLGVELQDDGRRRSGLFRTALYRAAVGVLRYSELDEDLELASRTIRDLVARRERELVEDLVSSLRGAGATISRETVRTVVERRAELKARRELEGLGVDPDRLR